ncbi:MAG: efflux RND transporter periplasmic adaptor subunit [Rhizobiales bacterium]|nr:efflux RND transporter periplasmic adaptor subunit [Hyphomicrobiales bacterium]
MTQIDPEMARQLGLDETGVAKSGFRLPGGIWSWLGIGLVIITLLTWFFFLRAEPVKYVMEPAKTGDLIVIVTATGSVEPVNTVTVGSEISGRIDEVLVDYNDVVKKGQLLARIDTTVLLSNVEKSKANLAAAEAAVAQAEATRREAAAKLKRSRALVEKGWVSKETLDTSVASAARAVANVASAKAQVVQAQAQLDSDRTTLAKADIKSPIDGVVISRDIDPGQTVAATFQTPTLFTVAEDLRIMELEVDVDEADVGGVVKGQEATFTVDAYTNKRFNAEITSLRFAPVTTNGVVSYTAVLSVDNQDLLLRPGMTATADIVTAERKNILMVPNGALRFTPPDETAPAAIVTSAGGTTKTVWTLDGARPKAISVVPGLTDGQYTEVLSGDVKDGVELLTDIASAEADK